MSGSKVFLLKNIAQLVICYHYSKRVKRRSRI